MLVMEAPAKRGNEMFGAAIIGQPKLFVDLSQISLDKLRFWNV